MDSLDDSYLLTLFDAIGWFTDEELVERQVHHHKLRFCQNPVFFFLILCPLRHRFGAAFHAMYNCWMHMKIDVAIFCFQLQNSLKFQNFWTQQFSPSLLCRDCSMIQIQKTFMIPDLCLLRQVSLLLCPSTRQGMHLSASLENSTQGRVLNFFFPLHQVSQKL